MSLVKVNISWKQQPAYHYEYFGIGYTQATLKQEMTGIFYFTTHSVDQGRYVLRISAGLRNCS